MHPNRYLILASCSGNFKRALGPFLAFAFFFLFFPRQACLTCFKPLSGVIGFGLFLLLGADFTFGKPIVLHQWDIAGANIGAGATLDAIGQVEMGGFVEFLSFGKPV